MGRNAHLTHISGFLVEIRRAAAAPLAAVDQWNDYNASELIEQQSV